MTVVNPKSISGINSITTGSGSDNLLTIHTSDANNTERVRVNSSGDVIVGSGITVSPDGNIFVSGISTFGGAISATSGTFSSTVEVSSGNLDIADSIRHVGDDNTKIRFPAADTVSVETGGSEALRVDSSGRLLIKETSVAGSAPLCVGNGGQELFEFYPGSSTYNGGFIEYIHRGDGTTRPDLNMYLGGPAAFKVYTNATERLNVASGGDVTVKTGNLVIGTSGKGIDFSATTDATGGSSELLDDYEEGTWTPTVNAIASPNYTVQVGRYTKIGNLVNAQAYLLMASGGGEGSAISIGSLPFTSSNTNYSAGGGYIIYENGFFSATAGSAQATCTVWVPENNTIIQFHERNSGNNIYGNSTAFGLGANNKYLIVQVQYVVA